MADAREREETRKLRLLALVILPPVVGGIFWLVFGLIGYLWSLSAGVARHFNTHWGQIGFWSSFVLTAMLIVRALILDK